MHIDIRVAGPGPWDMVERARLIRQKVPDLVAAGATVVREEWYGDVLGHVVMQDPEGVCCTDRWHLRWLALRAGWKDIAVPKPYPREFRDDVVRVARDREAGVTVEQVAKDFGVHPMTLFKWLRQADVDAGTTSGTASSESAELREARKRIRLLEQENEVLRRAA